MAEGGDDTAKLPSVSGKDQNEEKPDSTHEASNAESVVNLKAVKVVEIHKFLSDVGQFSLASLCCHLLRELFEDEWHSQFKKDTTNRLLEELHQPQQVCESILAILDGQGLDSSEPYVDTLMAEESIKKETAAAVLYSLLHMMVVKGHYDARLRTLLKHVAWQLRVSWEGLEEMEGQLAASLTSQTYHVSEEERKERAARAKKSKLKRVALIGLATIGGGTLIGLTGGLAAPLVAAGAGAVIGSAGAAVLGSTAGVAIIGSLFGVAGAGLTGVKMRRRVGAVEEFYFEPLLTGRHLQVKSVSTKQLHITIAITGWLTNNMNDFRQPWQTLTESREQYCLCWESKYLLLLGNALDYFLSCATSAVTTEALKYTLLSSVVSAAALPVTLLGALELVDNPFHVAATRAVDAGKKMADVLLSRVQGNRPVTLIGYSLGARVIFYCLEEMARRRNCEGVVEDVILLGAPVPGGVKSWSSFARVVSGRIVNGYCRGDWLLKFLYRTASAQFSIAGLAPVMWVDRRMHNIDLSDVVSGHGDYMRQLDTIMKAVGVCTRDELSTFTDQSSPGSGSQSSSSPSKVGTQGAAGAQGPKGDSARTEGNAYDGDVSSSEGWGVVSHADVIQSEDNHSSCSFTSSDSECQESENFPECSAGDADKGGSGKKGDGQTAAEETKDGSRDQKEDGVKEAEQKQDEAEGVKADEIKVSQSCE